MIFDHRCQLTPDLNHYCSNTCNFPKSTEGTKTSTELRSRNTYIRAPRFVYLGRNFLQRLTSLQKIQSLWPFFNLLKASEKFRSIRKMPNPAEIVLENWQVNPILPWNGLVRGLLRSPALRNQQNKLPGTVMEESLVETIQGFYTDTVNVCRDYILTGCNPVRQLRPLWPSGPSASIPVI